MRERRREGGREGEKVVSHANSSSTVKGPPVQSGHGIALFRFQNEVFQRLLCWQLHGGVEGHTAEVGMAFLVVEEF